MLKILNTLFIHSDEKAEMIAQYQLQPTIRQLLISSTPNTNNTNTNTNNNNSSNSHSYNSSNSLKTEAEDLPVIVVQIVEELLANFDKNQERKKTM